MSNVVPLHEGCPVTKEEVVESFKKNKEEYAILVYWDDENYLCVESTPMKRSDALWLATKLQRHILTEE